MASHSAGRIDLKLVIIPLGVHEQSADGPLGLGSSLPDGLKFSREQVTAIITGLHSTILIETQTQLSRKLPCSFCVASGAISLFLAFAYLFLARTLDSREMTPAVMDEDLPQMQSRL